MMCFRLSYFVLFLVGIQLVAQSSSAHAQSEVCSESLPEQDCADDVVLLQTHLRPQLQDAPQRAQETLLFVAVPVARNYSDSRDEVRKSWWQHPLVKNGTVKARFFVGEASPFENASVAQALAAEQAEHGDIIYLPDADTFKNLPNKTANIFRWFAKQQPAKFLGKVDHDSYPHLDVLVPELRAAPSRYIYMGQPILSLKWLTTQIFCNKDIGIWNPKWGESRAWKRIPRNIIGLPVMPKFMRGSAYVLSADLVEEIAVKHWYSPDDEDASAERIVADNEDGRVGLWVHLINQSVPVHYSTVRVTDPGCTMGDVFSFDLEQGELQCMWSNRSCCSEYFPKEAGLNNYSPGVNDDYFANDSVPVFRSDIVAAY